MNARKHRESARQVLIKKEWEKVDNICRLVTQQPAVLLPLAVTDKGLVAAWNRLRRDEPSATRSLYINACLLHLKKSDELSRLFMDTDSRLAFCGKVLGPKLSIKQGQANLIELLGERTNL